LSCGVVQEQPLPAQTKAFAIRADFGRRNAE